MIRLLSFSLFLRQRPEERLPSSVCYASILVRNSHYILFWKKLFVSTNQGFGAGAGVFGWSQSRHFGPAPAQTYIFVK